MKFLKPAWAVEWMETLKKDGFKLFLKKKGWKVVVALFVFYLIRDITLYIILPYAAITKVGGCS